MSTLRSVDELCDIIDQQAEQLRTLADAARVMLNPGDFDGAQELAREQLHRALADLEAAKE